MFFFAQSSTLNHKPQLGPQHHHHHDEVRKNGIPYAVGLMRSIAYPRIRLVNRKTAIIAKMTPHVGISSELIKPFVHRLELSCDSQGHVLIWLFLAKCTYEVLAGAKTVQKIATKNLQPLFTTSPSIEVLHVDACSCSSTDQLTTLWGKVRH